MNILNFPNKPKQSTNPQLTISTRIENRNPSIQKPDASGADLGRRSGRFAKRQNRCQFDN